MTEEPTSLDLLRDYECPEGCEFFVDGEAVVSEDDALQMVGGDENGVLRCIDCGAELEQTLESLRDSLAMLVERMPELAPKIADRMSELSEGEVT